MLYFFNVMDVVFPILFLLTFGFIIFTIIFSVTKNVKEYRKNKSSPRITVKAKIVSKRSGSTTYNAGTNTHCNTLYYATFEFDSGDRLELRVPTDEYGYLVEGDIGELAFQGTKFLGFTRSI